MKKSLNDTIAALGTRPGESAIGIIKLSGIDSIKIADRVFKAKNKKKLRQVRTYSMAYGAIKNSKGGIIDELLVSVMRKPGSYTREDVVEINCHGGMESARSILEALLDTGARLAEPGEFTRRAFLNGRIDLSQAEAVIDLVQSKTRQSLKIAAHNLEGRVKNEIGRLRSGLLEIITQLEASVDFIEEDLHLTPYDELKSRTVSILKKVSKLIEDEKKGEIIKNGIKAAIVGKTNVGKSSLLNILLKKDRAIVTEIPGTTRDAIEEMIYVEGIPLILVDTAGIRRTDDRIEKMGVERSIKHIDEAELVIMVLDGSREIDELDSAIIEKLEKKKKTVCCINKKDIDQKIDIGKIKARFPAENIIAISALNGQGIETLENRIKCLVLDGDTSLEEKVIVNVRQMEILKDVMALLEKAANSMKERLSEEFPCSDLRIAYGRLGEITGDTAGEDVLDKIFERFCIGK
jgi:tRNA modification GTPase